MASESGIRSARRGVKRNCGGRFFFSENGLVPERILFDPDPVIYDRSNWAFEFDTGDWHSLTESFVTILVPLHVGSKDLLSYQFSYLNIDFSSTIADPPNPQGNPKPYNPPKP